VPPNFITRSGLPLFIADCRSSIVDRQLRIAGGVFDERIIRVWTGHVTRLS
jgi:hypothetical protein